MFCGIGSAPFRLLLCEACATVCRRTRGMPLVNSPAGYGALTKLFHWLIALLILLQYTSAKIMLRTPAEATTLGLGQATYYNWHKSLGLVAALVMLARLVNRQI